MAVEALATPAQLRLWLDLEADDTDALPDARAQLLLDGVARAILQECHRQTFASVELTVRLDGSGGHELLLPYAPVTAVSTVTEDPDGTGLWIGTVELEPPGVDWGTLPRVEWSEHGILRRVDGYCFVRRFRFYEVKFTHGYPEVPEDVVNTQLRVAARAVDNPEGLATEGTTGYNAGFAFDETRLPVLSAPDRRSLDPYRL